MNRMCVRDDFGSKLDILFYGPKKNRGKTMVRTNGQPGALFPVAAIFVYLLVSLAAHLLWEIGHLRFYTIWTQGTGGEKVFAVLHCTAGDVLIAFFSLVAALLITCKRVWPTHQFWQVGILTLTFGLTYTVFSEWLRQSINQLDLHEPIEKDRQYDLDGIDEVETLKPYRNDPELVDAMVIHW